MMNGEWLCVLRLQRLKQLLFPLFYYLPHDSHILKAAFRHAGSTGLGATVATVRAALLMEKMSATTAWITS